MSSPPDKSSGIAYCHLDPRALEFKRFLTTFVCCHWSDDFTGEAKSGTLVDTIVFVCKQVGLCAIKKENSMPLSPCVPDFKF